MSEKLPLTAAVMAGGRSMRMGVDKTLLPLDGEALVARVIGVVGEVCAHTMVVTNRPESLDGVELPHDVRILSDEVPYQGPLGGLVTALAEAQDEWVLAVAGDMPFVSAEVVRTLWSARSDADVVVPHTDKGPEPLLALYSRRCLPAARGVLASGRRRLVALFRDVRVVELPAEVLREVDPGLESFMNVNTPEDLESARSGGSGRAAASSAGGDGVGGAVKRPSGWLGRSTEERGGRDSTRAAGSVRESRDPEPAARARPGSSGRSSAGEVAVICAAESGERKMPVERPITLVLDDREIATVQATPTDLDEMAAGFFVAEGLLTDRDELRAIDVDHKRGMVYVSTDGEAPREDAVGTRFVTSGCGKGITFSSAEHAQGMTPVGGDLAVTGELVLELMAKMGRSARAYRETGGMHACAIARRDDLLVVREDVGRHNAVDKALGRVWLDRRDTSELALLTTGRISYEMAVKAARAGTPLVVSRTAVTDQAAKVAGSLGVTLVGYARARKITVYTYPHRISGTFARGAGCGEDEAAGG